jgi:hypothetical protein
VQHEVGQQDERSAQARSADGRAGHDGGAPGGRSCWRSTSPMIIV